MKMTFAVFALLLLGLGIVSADVIMPDTHSVGTTVKFVNLNDYPGWEFRIIAVHPDGDVEMNQTVAQGQEVELSGYKFSSYYLVMKKGDEEHNATLDYVSSLPNSDLRQEVRFNYTVNYDAAEGTLTLAEAQANGTTAPIGDIGPKPNQTDLTPVFLFVLVVIIVAVGLLFYLKLRK